MFEDLLLQMSLTRYDGVSREPLILLCEVGRHELGLLKNLVAVQHILIVRQGLLARVSRSVLTLLMCMNERVFH